MMQHAVHIMKNRGRQAGFTLIELLLYVAIVGSLLLSVTAFFSVALEARIKSRTIAEINQQGSAAMDYMLQTIRTSTSITTPVAAGSGSSLTIVVPTASLSPTIFNLSGTTLQVKEGAAAAVSMTSADVQVSSITFKNLTRSGTNGIVQVSFTMSYTNPSNRNEYDYQKIFTGSAELRL
jgi:prepilin-type N-terminal cleavage/methylation domain-containing protein